ncbi:MAG: hypothetical protein HZB81_08870 [Deltaproteobacteria bacterium]|nr:hypothetical protein [Deltaproteobacteria bacterium]
MPVKSYLAGIKEMLILSAAIQSFEITDEAEEQSYGFIRVKGLTKNSALFEFFEYVFEETGRVITKDYSFHLQDKNGHLIKRWDNAPHHRDVQTFPHHLHDGKDVKSSKEMRVKDFIGFLEHNS